MRWFVTEGDVKVLSFKRDTITFDAIDTRAAKKRFARKKSAGPLALIERPCHPSGKSDFSSWPLSLGSPSRTRNRLGEPSDIAQSENRICHAVTGRAVGQLGTIDLRFFSDHSLISQPLNRVVDRQAWVARTVTQFVFGSRTVVPVKLAAHSHCGAVEVTFGF